MIDVNNETQVFICFNYNRKKEYGFAIEYKSFVNKKIEPCINYAICHRKFFITLIYHLRNKNCNFEFDRII